MTEIRRYISSCLPDAVGLFIETYNRPPWDNRWTEETAGRYLKEFTRAPRFIGFTAWQDGEMAGVALCREKTWWTGGELYVEELFVSPDFQHRGIGGQLLREIENHVKTHGLNSVTLLTSRRMPAMEFYRRHGFRCIEDNAFLHKSVTS